MYSPRLVERRTFAVVSRPLRFTVERLVDLGYEPGVKNGPRCRVRVRATGCARAVLALLLRLVLLARRLALVRLTEGARAVRGVPLAPEPLQARLIVGEVAYEVGQHVLGDRGQSLSGVLADPRRRDFRPIRWAYIVEGHPPRGRRQRLHCSCPSAAGSLREGLAGRSPSSDRASRRTLRSTNAMVSMIEICRDHSANLNCWRSGPIALRRWRGRARFARRNSSAASAALCTVRLSALRSSGTSRPASRPSPRYERTGGRTAEHRWPSPKFHGRSYIARPRVREPRDLARLDSARRASKIPVRRWGGPWAGDRST